MMESFALANSGTLVDRHPAVPGRLLRGKRRGDCCSGEAFIHGGGAMPIGLGGSGDCVPFAEAKRQCLGLDHFMSIPQCNSNKLTPFANGHHNNPYTAALANGHHEAITTNGHHHQDQYSAAEHRMTNGSSLSGQLEADMDTTGGCEMWQQSNIGFHNHGDSEQHMHDLAKDSSSNSKSTTTVPAIYNGYYGFIRNYEQPGSDHDEALMDMQAEYAIGGPQMCISPKEKRVCARCSAGEPGHITHIIGK